MGIDNERKNLALVGCGAAGAMVAIDLALRSTSEPLDLLIFEPNPRLGLGVAYSTGDPLHLLNVPVDSMSAIESDPDHLRRWAARAGLLGEQPQYLPRRDYGDYLAATLEEALARHRRRATVTIVPERVASIHPRRNTRSLLTTVRGGRYRADEILFAPGAGPIREPAAVPAALSESGRYLADPWGGDPAAGIRDGDTVLLIGTGLTMVDAALSIDATRRGTRVVAVSRSGLVPRAHRPRRPRLDPFPSPSGPVRIDIVLAEFFAGLGRAGARGGDATDVVDSMRLVTQQIWKQLPQSDRAWFLRHLRRLWEVQRHRMAPEVGRRIEALTRCGALQIRQGGLTELGLGEGRAIATLNGEGGAEILTVDRIVNCTGPEDDPTRAGFEPLAGMLAAGIARVDPLGLGIETTAAGEVVGADGLPHPHLHTIGSLRKGSLWESTAVPEIRRQAADLGERLAGRAGLSPQRAAASAPVRA